MHLARANYRLAKKLSENISFKIVTKKMKLAILVEVNLKRHLVQIPKRQSHNETERMIPSNCLMEDIMSEEKGQ